MDEQDGRLNIAPDELLKDKIEQMVGPNGSLKQLLRALLEQAKNAALKHHLG